MTEDHQVVCTNTNWAVSLVSSSATTKHLQVAIVSWLVDLYNVLNPCYLNSRPIFK